ncbi:hypothetical protein N7G274_003444 [Stereocaulon virgatum]|uniref:Uncharacterized protein n=1 Tax=Stereocaulon virgatum TaxID=373712 RepID=A0ABR4AGT1_9LECA
MACYSPVAGSRFDRSIASHTQAETTAGEFWTIKKEGEDWPLIICDEEMVQRYYVKKQRPANARQPDGTWPDGYKNGENGVGQRCYPTLFLGRYRCGWTPWKFLEPLDRDIGQAICISTTNPELAEAWREALFYQWRDDALSYFGERFQRELSERSHSKASIAAAPEERKRKRKGLTDFKYSPGHCMQEVDDEESSDLFVQEENNPTPKIKQEISDPTSSAEMEALYEDNDITTSPKPFGKKTKTNAAGQSYVPPANSFRSGIVNSSGKGTSQSVGHATPTREAKKRIINDPQRVMIYVDNPHKKFNVKRSGLEASPLLKTLLAHSPEVGWYIMSRLLSTLKENEFFPVDQYLERSEYDPIIVDEGTAYVRLAIELTGAERGGEAVRSATIYSVAQMLELSGLQDLAFRKLKALATSEPHQPFAILCIVETVLDQADEDLRQYLVQYLADHY